MPSDIPMGTNSPGTEGSYLQVSMQFEGQRELVARLATFGQQVTHLQPAWEQVGDLLLRDFAAQFTAEGGYLGGQIAPVWAQLRPSTVADRLRRGYAGEHPILERSGQLLHSATERNMAGNVFEATDSGLRIGTSDPIAKYHQYGTKRMPARKMIGLKFSTRSEIVRVFGDFIRNLLRGV